MTKSFDLVRDTILKNGDALFHAFIKLDKHIVKKNSRPIKRNRRTWKPFIGKSDELMVGEVFMHAAFRKAMMAHKDFKTIDRPVWAVFWFFFPAPDFAVKKGDRKGKLSNRLPDLSNLYELPQDCLQKASVISNDNLICSHDLSRRLPAKECALEVFLFDYPIESENRVDLKLV
jgi:Holliday junction resolvase RusA-like endonuclease